MYWVIQHVATGRIMPQKVSTVVNGYSHWEPSSELTKDIPPRLFRSMRAASIALGMWAQGAWVKNNDPSIGRAVVPQAGQTVRTRDECVIKQADLIVYADRTHTLRRKKGEKAPVTSDNVSNVPDNQTALDLLPAYPTEPVPEAQPAVTADPAPEVTDAGVQIGEIVNVSLVVSPVIEPEQPPADEGTESPTPGVAAVAA